MDDAAGVILRRLLGVLGEHVHAFHDDRVLLRVNGQDLALFLTVFSGDHADHIIFLDLHGSHILVLLYSTSGARETIFMYCFSLSSLATGPKIRVPLGVLSSRMMTAAFSSNLM